MELLLIRHGQSTANVDNNIYATTKDFEIPLTELGIQQALECGNTLSDKIIPRFKHTFRIIYSPYKRAVQTAEYLNCNLKLKSEECPLIYEQSISHCNTSLNENKHSHTKVAKEWNQWWYKEGTIESYADVYKRAMDFYLLLKSGYYSESSLIIVSHGTFLKIFLGIIERSPINEILSKYDIDNCEIIRVLI